MFICGSVMLVVILVVAGFFRISDKWTDFQIRKSMLKGKSNTCLPKYIHMYTTITQKERQGYIYSLYNTPCMSSLPAAKILQDPVRSVLLNAIWKMFTRNWNNEPCCHNSVAQAFRYVQFMTYSTACMNLAKLKVKTECVCS